MLLDSPRPRLIIDSYYFLLRDCTATSKVCRVRLRMLGEEEADQLMFLNGWLCDSHLEGVAGSEFLCW